ncbi:MAG: hypothetical protein HC880_08700 [Bacteroidia bacterium]|nr:hypothetical protein [Bacteroidia bacterium]
MKSLLKILLLSSFITVSSCDFDRVDTGPLGPTESSFFRNDAEFRQNLAGVYGKLYDYYYFNTWNNWVASTWYLPGDDLTETNGARTSVELFDGSLNPTNFQITYTFDKSYELINRANVMIEKVNTIDFQLTTTPRKLPKWRAKPCFSGLMSTSSCSTSTAMCH